MTSVKENVTENGSEETPEKYKAPAGLKILVVGLGLAIVAMLVLIVVKVIAGDHKKPSVTTEMAAATKTGVAGTNPSYGPKLRGEAFLSEIAVTRPMGSTLVSYSHQGRYLTLHFHQANGSDLLVTLDRVTGAETRVIVPQ